VELQGKRVDIIHGFASLPNSARIGFGRETSVMTIVNAAQILHDLSAPPRGLAVRLLGPLELFVDGAALALPSRKARALLGYLAIRQGTAVDRGILAELLWGDRSEEQARASLRQALSELKAALGEAGNAIAATRETVTWVEGAARTDARMVEAAAESKDPEALEAAATLLRGDLLEGLAVDELGFARWLAAERERFRLMASGIHAGLMHEAEAQGRIAEALEHGLRLLMLDPLQESVHRQLMRLHAAQGRQDAALAVFERCRRTLADELGVAPDAETQALARAIRARRTRATPAPQRNEATAGGAPIAVVPFATPGGAAEEAYLGDGIAEDIITELSRYQSLRVIARSSSFRFRGQDSAAVGEGLGVRYLVEGSVRRSGDRIRVSAQLVDTTTGRNSGRNGMSGVTRTSSRSRMRWPAQSSQR
jgi:DNA-binding SARP family transcriptional activator